MLHLISDELKHHVPFTALGAVTGIITNEDVLDRIFSEFCIGK